ncbi:MAG TPA: P-loop NTPase fold protein, partial [Pseudonocardiaceae bacterium]|nr:P-loop NTPase fold protein [Pseudonocardiaceae bacterium]
MSSVADPRWDQLTLSAKAACRWAFAVATTRNGSIEPSDVRVDTLDLLAGLTLAHLRDNPVSQLLAHFEIPPGAVLSDGGARRYDPRALLDAYHRTSGAGLPPLDKQATQVLEHALSETPGSKDGLVTLSMLFVALLEDPNAASTALGAELTNRGVDPEQVARSCREHLGNRTSYAEHLRKTHPYQPPQLQLPRYSPDEPRTRRPPAQPDAEPADLVGISAEVDAFAYLIAAKTLTPPLAIGLFGDWGSGKSYFLRSLLRRIDRLTGAEADRSPFHRAIVQVEFNAWQYVEGNLWASLLEHLFRNLRKAGEYDADDLLEERRSEYLAQITRYTSEHSRAVRKRDELAERQRQADQRVQDKRQERDRKLEELEQAQRRNPLRHWRASEDLQRTLDDIGQRTGLGELAIQAGELQQTLASTGETLRQAGPVLGALRTGGWRYTLALLLVIGLGSLAALVLSWLGVSAVGTVIGSGSALLAGITGYA